MPNFYSPIQTNKIPIKGLTPEASGSPPASPGLGHLWTDTSLSPPVDKYWNGVAWIRMNGEDIPNGTIRNPQIASDANIALSKLALDPTLRANHSGTQAAATISDFHTAVRTSRLDQMAVPTAAIDLNGQRATNGGDPLNPQDLVTRQHLENWVQGRINNQDWKASVRAATTGNIALSGTQTIDGIGVVVDDRVLVKAQTSSAQNGIYVVAIGAWTRALDANDSFDVTSGMTVPVEAGTTLAGTIWLLTTPNPITPGTTALSFSQIGAAGATYSAGNGLTLVGNQFALSTPVALANGGTGATTAAGARTALGVGTSYNADLPAMTAGTPITVTHNLGTLDVVVAFYEITSKADVGLEVTGRPDINNVQIRSDITVAASALRVMVRS